MWRLPRCNHQPQSQRTAAGRLAPGQSPTVGPGLVLAVRQGLVWGLHAERIGFTRQMLGGQLQADLGFK
jgi:hypothetical protein